MKGNGGLIQDRGCVRGPDGIEVQSRGWGFQDEAGGNDRKPPIPGALDEEEMEIASLTPTCPPVLH